ncbi:MAG: flavin reductase [Anaerolineales bacterium]|nr:flavin reductase [Anaerolineales bacterium]
MRQEIAVGELTTRPLAMFDKQWALLAAGDFSAGRYNCMTISWGSIGTMWNKPFALVVVRHSRYTYGFMENFDTFTVNVFPTEYRAALELLGSKSGRDGDKISEAGLTPAAAKQVAAPGFEEAELVLSCRKMYQDDMEPEHFLDPAIHRNYARKDYHRIYFGEVLAVEGTTDYRAG